MAAKCKVFYRRETGENHGILFTLFINIAILSKWASDLVRFAMQYGPFYNAKRTVLERKTDRIGKPLSISD